MHFEDIEKLLKVLKKFLDNGDTIFMIEHDQNILQFADDVIVLDEGQIQKNEVQRMIKKTPKKNNKTPIKKTK
ncbi:MAG: hypothetical protein GXP45_02395 [bacterium]|nr:hypothetical protein [bacterium]